MFNNLQPVLYVYHNMFMTAATTVPGRSHQRLAAATHCKAELLLISDNPNQNVHP
jgi:hypothetical protein